MTSKTAAIVSRYMKYMKDVFFDLDEMDQRSFWNFVGAPDDRFTNVNSIPPTWMEKSDAFDGKLIFIK